MLFPQTYASVYILKRQCPCDGNKVLIAFPTQPCFATGPRVAEFSIPKVFSVNLYETSPGFVSDHALCARYPFYEKLY